MAGGPIRDERGIALPMAMLALLMLSSLSIAFLALSQSEPVIANNHLRTAQARVLAEAGVEHAIWALSNTASSGITALPANGVAAATPYDGLLFMPAQVSTAAGGFTVRITGGRCGAAASVGTCAPSDYAAADYDGYTFTAETEGWVPGVGRSTVTGYDASDTRTKSHRKIRVVLIRYPEFALNTPCALCVNGDLIVNGNATISAAADTSCGNKYGTSSLTAAISGSGVVSGAPALGGTGSPNESGSDYQTGVTSGTFASMTLSTGALETLRQMARDQGTYYSGTTTFNNGNQVPAGKSIVFVDGNVSMSGNPYEGDVFNGWFIVIGSVAVNGNGTINGMLYATNDISSSLGTNIINGLVVSQNTTNETLIDTSAGGTMTVNFNCQYASGNLKFPKKFFQRPGSWAEPSG